MRKIITVLFILVYIPFYGQWWVPQNSGVTANLNDVYAITGNIVIVVGNGGTILKTIDGGTHWIQKQSGTFSNLMKVQFVNATIGFAIGENGTLIKSIDGGENWSSIPTGFSTNLYGLSCLNENVFYISGDNGLIKRTNDGGATFIDQNYAGTYSFRTIQFLNDQVGYAASHDDFFSTDSKVFIKTTDGGNTWTLLSNNVTSFHFLNENTGFVSAGTIYKTVNGGLDLQFIEGSIGAIADLFSMNENVVWNVDNSYTLCGCSTFCIVKSEVSNTGEIQDVHNCYPDTTNPPFTAITFADSTNGYVVGGFGLIYKNSTGTMQNLGIAEFDLSNNITITPNPASDLLTIINKNIKPLNYITITDINGRSVLETKTANTTLDVSSLSKGVYLVQIASNEGVVIKKLIKN